MGASQLALKAVKEDIEALDPRDRLAAAVKFAETAHQLGENIEQRGDADSYHQRLRRAVLFGYRLGAARQRTTQDVVLSPPHNPKSRKKQR
jgi:hypothetical protein